MRLVCGEANDGLRYAERDGPVTFNVVSIFQIEAAGWKRRTSTAIPKHQKMNRFRTEYGRMAAKLRILRLLLMNKRRGSGGVNSSRVCWSPLVLEAATSSRLRLNVAQKHRFFLRHTL